jgi:hypothetical protein
MKAKVMARFNQDRTLTTPRHRVRRNPMTGSFDAGSILQEPSIKQGGFTPNSTMIGGNNGNTSLGGGLTAMNTSTAATAATSFSTAEPTIAAPPIHHDVAPPSSLPLPLSMFTPSALSSSPPTTIISPHGGVLPPVRAPHHHHQQSSSSTIPSVSLTSPAIGVGLSVYRRSSNPRNHHSSEPELEENADGSASSHVAQGGGGSTLGVPDARDVLAMNWRRANSRFVSTISPTTGSAGNSAPVTPNSQIQSINENISVSTPPPPSHALLINTGDHHITSNMINPVVPPLALVERSISGNVIRTSSSNSGTPLLGQSMGLHLQATSPQGAPHRLPTGTDLLSFEHLPGALPSSTTSSPSKPVPPTISLVAATTASPPVVAMPSVTPILTLVSSSSLPTSSGTISIQPSSISLQPSSSPQQQRQQQHPSLVLLPSSSSSYPTASVAPTMTFDLPVMHTSHYAAAAAAALQLQQVTAAASTGGGEDQSHLQQVATPTPLV